MRISKRLEAITDVTASEASLTFSLPSTFTLELTITKGEKSVSKKVYLPDLIGYKPPPDKRLASLINDLFEEFKERRGDSHDNPADPT